MDEKKSERTLIYFTIGIIMLNEFLSPSLLGHSANQTTNSLVAFLGGGYLGARTAFKAIKGSVEPPQRRHIDQQLP